MMENLDEIEIAAITIKGLGPDSFGINQYMWATKKQTKRLLELQFDEKMSQYVFILGDRSIRPCDIISVKFMKVKNAVPLPSFRPYVIKELEEEYENETRKLSQANQEKIKRLDNIKNSHQIYKISL